MLSPDKWHLLNNRGWDPLPERPELQSVTLDQKRAQWDECMAAIGKLRTILAGLAADTVVMVGDDQRENFVEDGMPAFAVYMGHEVEASVSLRYTGQSFADNRRCYRVDVPLAQYVVEQLLQDGRGLT